jgi:hypothetical protein
MTPSDDEQADVDAALAPSSAAACVSARTAALPAAHRPRPGLARRPTRP